MKKQNFIGILMLTFSSLLLAQCSTTIEPIKSDEECRMCYGKLVVSNGVKTDTIYGGQWGAIPNHKKIQVNNQEYLMLDNEHFYSGGTSYKFIEVFSLRNRDFMELVLKKQITLYRERYSDDNDISVNYIYRNDPIIKIKDSLFITNRITIERCPETVGNEKCDTILKFEDTERFYLGN